MITLREFLKIIRDEQYRIYQPNRDCLIFESYFKIHSPYHFTDGEDYTFKIQEEYWDNNDYCRGVYTDGYKDPAYDKETSEFLDYFGDYEVFSVECSSCRPTKLYKDKNGKFKVEYLKDPRLPDKDWIPCFNIFIIPYDKDHQRECDRCHHSSLKEDLHQPDPKDIECKNCWRYKRWEEN
jgi:hypothetical protein